MNFGGDLNAGAQHELFEGLNDYRNSVIQLCSVMSLNS